MTASQISQKHSIVTRRAADLFGYDTAGWEGMKPHFPYVGADLTEKRRRNGLGGDGGTLTRKTPGVSLGEGREEGGEREEREGGSGGGGGDGRAATDGRMA